ncbi:MAG: asparagine synthase (glutamine-hydrolyzing) [Nanoarchaeota archaeon]
MCGIIGFNWEDNSLLNKVLKEISHRGPDDSGKFTDKNISLGFRRLSIIDLSKDGKQPMSNEDGTIWIIFNGEIYNFKELRKELETKGHKFKSNTDTETIIHLYEESSSLEECLKKLNGMFAFCIYDSKKKVLFLARDRAGVKPLYYYSNNKKFIFCSEIKGILKDEEIKREVNLNSVYSFLTFRENIEEETCFKGIKKLIPGNYLTYNLVAKKISKKTKYWDINFKKEYHSEGYFIKAFRNLINDSIKKRLMSDVPFGAYLSGGVDSGTVVSIMKKFCSKPIETFSVGFEEKGYNETDESRFLAENLNTNHHELIIGENSIFHLPKIIYHLDEPMSDPTSIPIFLLSKYTKKYCTVILTGEGADEVFAGYHQYKFMKIHKNFIRPLPLNSRKVLSQAVKLTHPKILNSFFRFSSELGEKGIERFDNFLSTNSYSKQYLNQVSIFNEEEKKELMKKNYPGNYYDKYKNNFNKNHLLDSCLKFDFKGNMVDDLLMKLDKNTMAFSIEGRVPFLDYRIIELAFKTPENLKLTPLNKDKYILRKAVKDLLPKQTYTRKKKHFFVPINKWFRNELLQIKEDLLSENYIKKQGIFNYKYIDKVNKNFDNSRLFYARQLWSLITFQIWYKKFIENEKIKI